MFQVVFRNVLVLLVLSASSFTIAFASENRVALVIGNSAYRHASVLDNPKNDAADMAVAAEKLGFKVIKGLDLDKSGMDRTIRRFAEALRGASIGMFFYAGHGLQVSGRNYLVPIDAELKAAEALDFEMVGLDVVQRIMEAASETNILFVDACRDNPLSRNLARAMGTRSTAIGHGLTAQEAGAGTLISFSTQPGNVALDGTGTRNSPYAGALAKHIATQGKDLPAVLVQVRRDVMATTGKRQIPWEHSALTAEVMLAPGAPVQTSAKTAPEADVPGRNDGTRSELKAATTKTVESVAKPEEPKNKTIITIKKPGVLDTRGAAHYHYVYDESGKNRITKSWFKGEVDLPPGRYGLVDGQTDHIAAKLFEINAGETIYLDQLSGFISVKDAKHYHYVYDESGAIRFTKSWFKGEGVFVPPGRYSLIDGQTDHVAAKSFEITSGEKIDLEQLSGQLVLKGGKHYNYVYDESGKNRITKSWFKDTSVYLPAGRYSLMDGQTDHIVVESFEIKVDKETVIDFGG